MSNALYYGDNLDILRREIATESVDLIYLDPPFNSNRDYNVLFREKSGEASPAQIRAFTDTWTWDRAAEAAYEEIMQTAPYKVRRMISAMDEVMGPTDMMSYLVMMTLRLVELHRVLKPTGTLYLHCDPTASHYLKILLDTVFGKTCFLNEVSWKRSSAHSDVTQGMKRFGRIRDVILVYAKSGKTCTFNPLYTPYTEEYLKSEYRHITPDGCYYKETDLTAAKPGGDTSFLWRVRRPSQGKHRWQADLDDEYLHPVTGWEYRGVSPYRGRYWGYSLENLKQFAREGRLIHRETGMPRLMQLANDMPGIPLQDDWGDIGPASGAERLGYPTQKPLALLERIIATSSDPGDVILDPFCGCGTAVAAAQKLGRQWIGIDITYLAVALIKGRMKAHFGDSLDVDVSGVPMELGAAKELARRDRYGFQYWALSLINALPAESERKKGADRGIDGVRPFHDDNSRRGKRCIVQVKSGKVGVDVVRDLRGTVEREGAEAGLLITLQEPTAPMRREAAQAGTYHARGWNRDIPKLQILTVQELLNDKQPDLPPVWGVYETAERIRETYESERMERMAGFD